MSKFTDNGFVYLKVMCAKNSSDFMRSLFKCRHGPKDKDKDKEALFNVAFLTDNISS